VKVAVGDVSLEVEELGNPSAPPLLLIMGLGSQLIHWPDPFCEMLADAGYRVVRFDNRDIGLSTGLSEHGTPSVPSNALRALLGLPVQAPYTLTEMAHDALGVLDALSIERAHVVGISMGGMIAQTLSLLAPERVLTLTSLMSSPRAIFLPKPSALLKLVEPPGQGREAAIQRSMEVFDTLRGPRFHFDPELHRALAERVYDRAPGHPGACPRQLSAILASGSRVRALRSLRLPTLVVHGSADPLIPFSAGKATARAIPAARFHAIEGLGHHLPPGVWPEMVGAIVDHLRRPQEVEPQRAAARPVTGEVAPAF